METKVPYSIEELALIDLARVPHHIAIIMDGNRRWAKEHDLPAQMGHWEGAEVVSKVVRAAVALGVKVLTVYAFSTENWGRSSHEIEALMELFHLYLLKEQENMIKDGIKLDAIGDLKRLPFKVRKALQESKEATKQGTAIELVLALNYGGRDDIRRGVLSLIDDVEQGLIKKEEISEETISNYLDTAKWKDPDLLIRTSGAQRLSNFLLWQISYAEVYVTNVLWPEFNEKEFLKAIIDYTRRRPKYGV